MPPQKHAREECPAEVNKLVEWLKETYGYDLPEPETWRAEVRIRPVPGTERESRDTFYLAPQAKKLTSRVKVACWLGLEASQGPKKPRPRGSEDEGDGDVEGGCEGGEGAARVGLGGASRKGRVTKPSLRAVEAAADEAAVADSARAAGQEGVGPEGVEDGLGGEAPPRKAKRPRVFKRRAAAVSEGGDADAAGGEGMGGEGGEAVSLDEDGAPKAKKKKKRVKKDKPPKEPKEPKEPKPPKPKAVVKGILQSPDEDEIITPAEALHAQARPVSVVPQFKRPTVAPRPKPPPASGAVAAVQAASDALPVKKVAVAPHCCTLRCPANCQGWVGLVNLVKTSSNAGQLGGMRLSA
jgi:hypothetical protein